jgi:hypothetical protein
LLRVGSALRKAAAQALKPLRGGTQPIGRTTEDMTSARQAHANGR